MGRALGVVIWLLALASVYLFVGGHWWFPKAITEHAPAIDRQFLITIIVVGVSFLVVAVVMAVAVMFMAVHVMFSAGTLG